MLGYEDGSKGDGSDGRVGGWHRTCGPFDPRRITPTLDVTVENYRDEAVELPIEA